MIYGIVCTANNWGIGKNNGLLFNIKEDMNFFKSMTLNKVVCMGENTLLSFPKSKPLKNRVNIVLCKEGHEYEGCICVHTFEQMVKMVQVLSQELDVFVIGGGMFYKSMLPYYDGVFVTRVQATDPEATVFFPNLDENENFILESESEIYTDEKSGLNFSFNSYVNKELVK